MKPEGSLPYSQEPSLVMILSKINPIHTTAYFSNIHYNIVACYATDDAVLIGKWVLLQFSPVATIRNYYTVTHLQSLQSVHSNIPFYLFGVSGIHLETANP
jgi:hypothetical protein